MFSNSYKITDSQTWQGRVDSKDNYDAFRWHQWVEILDLRRDDLTPYEGKLGFAFIGFCCDEGVKKNKGRTGAANGPKAIRKELSSLPCRFTKEVKLFDAGDIFYEDSLEKTQEQLNMAVKKVLDLNLFPIVLGGGHEVAFGSYKGILEHLKQKYKKPNIGIINFDAHFDLRPYPDGGSSGSMFHQIADICKQQELDFNYLCLGIQKHSNTRELFSTADNLGVKYVLAKDIIHNDIWSTLEKIDDFLRMKGEFYITICSDVFSSSVAPGVSSTQPLGLEPEKVIRFIKYILRTKKIIGFDVAEVAPRFDQDNTTANLVSVLIFALVTTMADNHNLSW
ncbi:formimidoylglutamase [Proteinivorax hydrogeniformans]|uniref:Formimidoylglutamase n=1 Tax=Proteinivorax hydrogeniformans TaxID=1826727 RepID=A0AAU8HUN1_9FIRM